MTGPVTGIRRRRTVAGRRETPHLPPDRDFYEQKINNYEAYRVGMFVTWPARKVYGGIKCLRENGVKYTVKHTIGKVLCTIGKVLRRFGSTCKW